jgi:hypothetical protein
MSSQLRANDNQCIACNSTTYYNDVTFLCTNCPPLCYSCTNSTNCLGCRANSHLSNHNICECDKGFTFNSYCLRNYFNATMTVSSNNIIKIFFSEALNRSLTTNDILAQINTVEQKVSLTYINTKCYQIDLSALMISEKSQLSISFTAEVYSLNSSLLNTTKLIGTLFSLSSDQVSSLFSNPQTTAKIITYTTIGTLFGSTLITSNPSFLFVVFNLLDFYAYSLLLSISMDPLLVGFVMGLQTSSIIPNPLNYILPSENSNNIPVQLQNFGYNSYYFVLNSAQYLTTIIMMIGAIPFFYAFRNVRSEFLRKIITKIEKSFPRQAFLRFFIQSFLSFLLNSIIGIIFNPKGNSFDLADLAISILFLVFSI